MFFKAGGELPPRFTNVDVGIAITVSVNFDLVLFGWKFISILTNEPDESVQ